MRHEDDEELSKVVWLVSQNCSSGEVGGRLRGFLSVLKRLGGRLEKVVKALLSLKDTNAWSNS